MTMGYEFFVPGGVQFQVLPRLTGTLPGSTYFFRKAVVMIADHEILNLSKSKPSNRKLK